MEQFVFSKQEYAAIARQAAAEGCVLLENRDAALPLAAGTKVAVFGRSQYNYYKSGTGSGGLVNTEYVIGLDQALQETYQVDEKIHALYQAWLKDHPFDPGNGWGTEPWYQEEMPMDDAVIAQAAKENEAAVMVIGRTAGEDRDNNAGPGSYLLTELEEQLLAQVCKAFKRVIVLLNVGSIIDMSWVSKYQPSAVMYVWQGGQVGGYAVTDVMSGAVNPSGHLADTIAAKLSDYPSDSGFGDDDENPYEEDIYVGYRYFETFAKDKVLYPFGYGLSYTDFTLQGEAAATDCGVTAVVTAKNIGAVAGKAVAQIYVEAPQGKLGKAQRVLCGFAKTQMLDAGASEQMTIEIPWKRLASYDETGVTGYASAMVLEAGEYCFYAGQNVREAACIGSITLQETMLQEQLHEAMASTKPYKRMINCDGKPVLVDGVLKSAAAIARRNDCRPVEYAPTGDVGLKLEDVESGKATMEQFIAQLSDHDLACIVRGEGMSSPKVTPGVAGCFGGVTDSLLGFGIPLAACSDGPSGIRMDSGDVAFAMPNGTSMACSWNEPLIEKLFIYEGYELRMNEIDTLLGPGMNIHRHPLNGRNFEYFSEDPLLAGRMAVAQLHGMEPSGTTGTIKHFACNNQETRRHYVSALVSERALREIYLKPFELAVREGGARSIMTSYNPINSIWSASNYDMLTTVLREEWGYTGIVMTDWWARGNEPGEDGAREHVAVMVRAQNDLYMVNACADTNSNGDDLETAIAEGRATRGEFQRTAMNICRFLLGSRVWARKQGRLEPLDAELAKIRREQTGLFKTVEHDFDLQDAYTVPQDVIRTEKGTSLLFHAKLEQAGSLKVELRLHATDGYMEAAQMPVTIYEGDSMIATVMITGKDRDWREESIQLPTVGSAGQVIRVRVLFAQSGVEVDPLRFVLAKQ